MPKIDDVDKEDEQKHGRKFLREKKRRSLMVDAIVIIILAILIMSFAVSLLAR